MAFKGTADQSTLVNLRSIEDAGAVNFSQMDRTSLTVGYTCSPSAAGDLLSSLNMTNLAHEPWDVAAALKSSSLDQTISKTTPELSLEDQLHAAAYGEKTPHGRSMYGSPDKGDVLDFTTLLTTSGAVLSISGVSDHALYAKLATEALPSTLPPSSSPPAVYKGGQSRVNALSSHSHVALALNAGSHSPALTALLTLTSPSPLTAFTVGTLSGVHGAGDAETADVMTKAMAASFTAALKADDATLSRALSLAKATAVFSSSGSSKAASLAASAAVLSSTPAGESAIIAFYAAMTPTSLKTALEEAVAKGVSVAAVGDLGKVGYAEEFKF